MKKTLPTDRWRRPAQYAFLVLIALIAVNHGLEERGKAIPYVPEASLHAVCPFGGVVTVHRLATEGKFVPKLHESALVLGLAVFASAILVGPAFCGWICPLGTVEELFGRLGRRIIGKRYGRLIPKKLDGILKYARYVVLILVIYATAKSVELVFAKADPYYALFQFWTGEVAISAILVLAATLLLSLVVDRPFCRYACPYGAFLGLTNLFRIMPVRRRPSTCISCSACDRACPMGITVSVKGAIRDVACISCLKCTSDSVCPVEDTVALKAAPWKETDHGE